jgi:translation initiation factor 2B subunit (eIF-2B alpha/beta/delta family)
VMATAGLRDGSTVASAGAALVAFAARQTTNPVISRVATSCNWERGTLFRY